MAREAGDKVIEGAKRSDGARVHMSQLRLGYLVPEFPAQTHAFFWREVQALAASGMDVRLVSTREPSASACPHAFSDEARARTHYLFPPSGGALLGALARPGAFARALSYVATLGGAERVRQLPLLAVAADLVAWSQREGVTHLHVHSCARAAHLAALAHRLGGPTYSLTLHGDLEVYGRDHGSKMADARFVSTVTRPLQRQVLDATALPPERVPVIRMGVDTDRFAPDAASPEPAGPLRLLTVARLAEVKGHRYALDAILRARESGAAFRYTIAGDGPHRDRVEAAVAERGLGDCVSLVGRVSEDEVLRLLHACDVFVLPSYGLGEAAPVSVMEAMACGRAVVCSRIGGTPDMIRDGVDGVLVDQRDAEGLAAAFARLAAEPEWRRGLASAARERAVALFDYRACAAELRREIEAWCGA